MCVVCMGVHVRIVCICVHTCMAGSQIILLNLVFPGLLGWPASSEKPFVSTLPVLGVQTHIAIPGFVK